jgi:hypothetical protein
MKVGRIHDLRVEFGAQGLENFFPVLMGSQAAAWREADHVARVELSRQSLAGKRMKMSWY